MSDYSWIGPVIQGVAGAVGSQQKIAGADQATGLTRDAYNRALQLLASGQLTPQAAQALGITSPSALANLQADPQAVLAQRDALMRLQEASRTGFDTIDRAAINRTLSETNASERGNREAALARLDPNSGAAMAARLSAQQTGANRANQQGLDIAAASRKRALDALGAYGNLASDIRKQSFGEGKTRGEAADAIAKFNAETSRFNAGQQNTNNQANINNIVAALNTSNAAGGAYGSALQNKANLQGQQTADIGKFVSNGVNAAQGSGSDKKTDNTDDTYEYDPEYGGD